MRVAVFVEDIHDAFQHLFLCYFASVDVAPGEIPVKPDFNDCLFVNADVLLLNFEKAILLGDGLEARERLKVEMEAVWERYVFDIGQSDRDFLDKEGTLMCSRAELMLFLLPEE